MRKFLITLFAALPAMLIAQELPSDEEFMKRVMNNVSHEYTVCAAYFMFVSNALAVSGKDEGGQRYDELSDLALMYAMQSASVGRSDDMAQKVVTARLETEVTSMAKEIDNDNANISILNVKHLERCKWAMEDVEAVMSHWTTKELQRLQEE